MNIFTRSLLVITLLIASSALHGAAAAAVTGVEVTASPTLKAAKLIEAIKQSSVTIPLKTRHIMHAGTVIGIVHGLDTWVSDYCDYTEDRSFLSRHIANRYATVPRHPGLTQEILHDVKGQLTNVLIELAAWFESLTAENKLALRERYNAVYTQVEEYKIVTEAAENLALADIYS